MEGKRFGWYCSSINTNKKASSRIRVLQPISNLQKLGVDIDLLKNFTASNYDAIIISTIYNNEAVKIAKAAVSSDIPVFMDLCDNIIERAERRGQKKRVDIIKQQLDRASAIIFATNDLRLIITDKLPNIRDKSFVIPDMLEKFESSIKPSIFSRFRMKKLDDFLKLNNNSLHCVWFGKNSDTESGISHIDLIMPELERYNKEHGLTLTIISNKFNYYRRITKDWIIPHFYVNWKLHEFLEVLKKHRVAIIPIYPNSYTLGKTINRPATALMAGIGVLASSIPSYRPLNEYIYIDDWARGLRNYDFNWDTEKYKITQGQAYIKEQYNSERIAKMWHDLLKRYIVI